MTNFIILIILIWKSVDFTGSIIAPHFIPYLGFFSYGDTMLKYGLPDMVRKLSNFDGIMYIRIATQGYSTTEQAYFPLYPLLIRLLNSIIHNPIIAGVTISTVLGVISIFVFAKYLRHQVESKDLKWVLLALIAYPTSYYYGVMYTESLFFALLVSTLLSLHERKWLLSFLFGYLIALTRVQGIFVLIPVALLALQAIRLRERWSHYAVIALGPVLGLSTYIAYLWQSVGDPLYFIHAQESFGAHRSSHLVLLPQVIYRYFKIFLTADLSFQYFVAILEFVFFTFVLSLLVYDIYLILKNKILNYQRLGLNLFSFANVIVPSLTGTLTSIPRYTMMALSIYLVIGEIKSKILKLSIIIIFMLLHIIMYSYYIQGYFLT